MAMSAPAFGGHTAYRNDIDLVAKMLSARHYGRYMVLNLCDTVDSSDGVMGNYHPRLLYYQVLRIPFEDHGPPLMVEMLFGCMEGAAYLSRHPRNVIAVHCKGGKGRTGAMIAGLLLWTGHRGCAMDALQLFSFRRTQDYQPHLGLYSEDGEEDGHHRQERQRKRRNQGVDGPSQVRYVLYTEAVVRKLVPPWGMPVRRLESLVLGEGAHGRGSKRWVSWRVRSMRTLLVDSEEEEEGKVRWAGRGGGGTRLEVGVEVWGDVRVDVWVHRQGLTGKWHRKPLLFVMLHTAFYQGRSHVPLNKVHVDGPHKDVRHRVTPKEFTFAFTFAPQDTAAAPAPVPADLKPPRQLLGDSGGEGGGRGRLEAVALVVGREKVWWQGQRIQVAAGEMVVLTHGAAELCLGRGGYGGKMAESEQDGEGVHPLGKLLWRERGGDGRKIRVAPMGILGRGAVVGATRLLTGSEGIGARVRSEYAAGLVVSRRRGALPGEEFSALSRAASAADVAVEGVEGLLLVEFYRGLAEECARMNLRVREEVLRTHKLRLLSNVEAVVGPEEERERVRSACIAQFGLPLHSQVRLQSRCESRIKEGGRWRTVRLLVLEGFLVLDRDVFGPAVHPKSEVMVLEEMQKVTRTQRRQRGRCGCGGGKEWEEVVVVGEAGREWQLRFQGAGGEGLLAWRVLEAMGRVARLRRQGRQKAPMESALLVPLFRGAHEHLLRKGQRFRLRSQASFLLVRSGTLKFFRSAERRQVVREGSSFGLAAVLLGLRLRGEGEAITDRLVCVEVEQQRLQAAVAADPALGAALYRAMAVELEEDTVEQLREAFPDPDAAVPYSPLGSKTSPRRRLSASPPRRLSAHGAALDAAP